MKVCLSCQNRFEAEGWHCPRCKQSPELFHGHVSFAPDLAEANDGFRAEYFTQLAELEARNFWFRSRNRLLIWALRQYFPYASKFLEIGCGTGFVLSGIQRQFPELMLSGSEIFNAGLTFAEERLPSVTLFQMDARRIPFDAEFDVIGAFDMLEHIEEDDTVLLQMYQATKPDGGVILTVPQHRFLWSIVDEYSFHKRRYTRKEFMKKVERAGFEIVRVTSFVFFLLPLMLLSRLKQSIRSRYDFDLMAELKIVPLLNLALESVLEFESILIKSGFSFPAGGSLLVIAKKHG
jgi:SAM-dependent methyltransferase